MYIIIGLFFLIFASYIFLLFPPDALYYLRPTALFILGILHFIPAKLIKKKFLPVFIYILNTGSCFAFAEVAKLSLKETLIIIAGSSIILLLILIKSRFTRFIGFLLIGILLMFFIWQGDPIIYKSNLFPEGEKQFTGNFFQYGMGSDLETYSVDSSSYYNGNTGLAGWYDREYWGFSTDLPLNGRVYYPDVPGNYPLVIVVHGNHLAEDFSEKGYDYLLKNLASNGYIAVSVDQNFLNGNWTTFGLGQPQENDARGYLILEHLKLFKKWNNDPDSQLFENINMEEIGLIGHSRGGEAVSIASSTNSEFNIKAVMAIAPTDRQFRKNIYLEDISYMVLHGANDGDIESFKGKGQYNRTKFTNDNYNFKVSYYIEGVNHAQFNSDWGRKDSTGLGKILHGTNYNIDAADQRKIVEVMSLNFFNSTLKGDREHINLIQAPLLNSKLPEINYITEFEDSSMITLYNFKNPAKDGDYYSKDIKLETVTRRFNRSLKLNGEKGCSIVFNNKFNKDKYGATSISIASESYSPQYISLQFENDDYIVSKVALPIPPALKKVRYKTDFYINGTDSIESHFQSYTFNVDEWEKLTITLDSDASILIDNINLVN